MGMKRDKLFNFCNLFDFIWKFHLSTVKSVCQPFSAYFALKRQKAPPRVLFFYFFSLTKNSVTATIVQPTA